VPDHECREVGGRRLPHLRLGSEPATIVTTGENKAITPQELEQVVPKEQIDRLAQQTGATPEQAEEVLAQALPQVVDRVTPDGQLPQQAQLDDMLGPAVRPEAIAPARRER
jgi:uncharacterized protein YidB (DUF937 family)